MDYSMIVTSKRFIICEIKRISKESVGGEDKNHGPTFTPMLAKTTSRQIPVMVTRVIMRWEERGSPWR